jgi:signal peptidase II
MVLKVRDYVIIALLVALDQLTKVWALVVQPKNAWLYFTTNTGAGFGILQGMNWILLAVSLGVLALIWKPLHTTKGLEHSAYLVLAAGIIGNSIDRVVHQAVIDFVNIVNSLFPFAIFNLADSYITVSILTLIGLSLVPKKKSSNSS